MNEREMFHTLCINYPHRYIIHPTTYYPIYKYISVTTKYTINIHNNIEEHGHYSSDENCAYVSMHISMLVFTNLPSLLHMYINLFITGVEKCLDMKLCSLLYKKKLLLSIVWAIGCKYSTSVFQVKRKIEERRERKV